MSTRHADYRRSIASKGADQTSVLLPVDRLTRLGQAVSGSFAPATLPEIADYLVSGNGQVDYRVTGNTQSDQSGRHQKRLQCIISGWIEVLDAATLAASRFELNIESRLVLVASEDELPPLEDEPDEEDFIVCGQDFDITALKPCAYIVWLEATLRLTVGYGAIYGTFSDHIAFCKT